MSRRTPRPNRAEARAVRSLDQLGQYEEFAQKILPKIRRDLEAGLDAEAIIKKYAHFAAARLVSDLLKPKQGSESAKEILNRAFGKATQKTETTHKFAEVKDEELDSMVLARLRELGDDTSDKPKH